jgi:predicted small lipoprotein YifL
MRSAIVVLAVCALAGCGAGAPARQPSSEPAPDPQRTQDLVPLTTKQAVRAADRVALVVARGSRVVERAPGTPFTRTAFEVQEVLKGRLPHRFVVQVIGGRLGDRIVSSPVQAFAPSRRYLVFLGPDGPAGPTIFPQAIYEGRGLDAALRSVRRELRGGR